MVSRRLVRGGVFAWTVVIGLLLGSLASATGPTEYELKAIFLYNFAKYVEWPDSKPDEPGALVFCILGHDPFGEVLDQVFRGERVQGRSLVVRRIASVTAADSCHLVFTAREEEGRLPELLSNHAERPVLTVGETDDFARRGGIIGMRDEQKRIHLTINVDAAERAGLRISSQLLKLGDVIRTGGD